MRQDAATRPEGVAGPSPVSFPYSHIQALPAKTNITIEKSSSKAALIALRQLASPGAILLIVTGTKINYLFLVFLTKFNS